MIYLKYIGTLLVYGLAYVVGMIVHPLVYAMRFKRAKNGKRGGFLWWWANAGEQGGGDPAKAYIDNWFGVYELVPDDKDAAGNVIKDKYDKFKELNAWRKYWLSYEWLALRNSHWNLKKVLYKFEPPFTIVKTKKFKGDSSPLTWRNGTIQGVSHIVVQEAKGRKSFRYSRTWGKVKGNYLYTQLGAGQRRYHFKMRRGKLGADNK